MRASWILASTLTALAAAADSSNTAAAPGTTAITYFSSEDETGMDLSSSENDFAARVIGISEQATTYEISCAKSAKQCTLQSPITMTQGPETYSVSMVGSTKTGGAEGHVTVVQACSFTQSSESAVCSWTLDITASQGGNTISTVTSGTESIEPESVTYRTLEITDGVYAFTAEATGSASPVKITATASAGGAGAAKPLITAAPLGAAAVAAFAAML
ncbi:hypothetical protein N7475_003458 [Penicillium sp. IBT 31633x]|nr:hypothetical protein N7475_003458 [Penicillium sp. IBT 31633x]